ncbi:MAG: hypothetical protein NDJ75_09775 [Thermoanaerobaculia bacterium]|nr:hypothetical protein [Thermoanaerobaculia bacterium]
MRSTFRLSGTALAVLLVPMAAAAAWRSEGPPGGNVQGLATAPSAPDTVYAATAGGGVWRSDDGGGNWSLAGPAALRGVRWIAVDPSDARVLWAGSESRGGGSGLWRSADGGATWKAVADSYPGGRVQATGARIAFAPSQPKTILVASTNLHYRTDDGGKTWRDFRVPNQDAYAFAFHPADAKIVYAAGRGDNQHVARSADGGKTWRQVGVGLGTISLERLLVDPAAPDTLYAAGGTFAKLFKSTDRGDRWSELALPVGGTSDLYDLALAPGGVLWAATEDGLLKSADGGATWTRADRGTGRYWLKAIAVDPRDGARLVAGAGGDGIYASRDGGANWTPSGTGLHAAWGERLWGAPGSASLFAQLSIGLFRHDGRGWSEVTAPFSDGKKAEVDGFLFDAASPQTIYAFDTSKYFRSTDGGARWQEVEQKGPSMRDMMKGSLDSPEFASMAQERGNPKVLYAGAWSNDGPGTSVYKTTDGGKKWTPAGQGLPGGERVERLRAGAAGTLFAVVDDHGVFRTTDGGASWSPAGAGLPDAELHELAVHPGQTDRLFAATEKGLYVSIDSGASWSRVGVGAGLEDEEVEAVAIDPASGAVFAGSFGGVFRSADGGTSWAPANDGLPNTDVRALAIAGSPPRLWAGVAGGSFWSTELP